jgi:pimeloyl-ACP methyl ester carboxylesterase
MEIAALTDRLVHDVDALRASLGVERTDLLVCSAGVVFVALHTAHLGRRAWLLLLSLDPPTDFEREPACSK